MIGPLTPPERRRDERGSMAVEAAIGLPAFALFIGLIIMGGRVEIARQSVESAAYDAARAASIERTRAAAITAATAAAHGSLKAQNVHCVTRNVSINSAAFDAALGVTGDVTVTVTCHVDLSDLSLPGVPGSRTITETASSPLDAHRERR